MDASTLPEGLRENLREVASVVGQICSSEERGCWLSSLDEFAPGEHLSDESLLAAGVTENFSIAIDGYGSGLCSLVVL